MQARTTVSSPRINLLLWLAACLGVGLLALVPLSLLRGGDQNPTPPASLIDAAAANLRVAYMAFGAESDVLYFADAADPNRREARMTIPHAADYGVVANLSPDRKRLAYLALPAGLKSPTAETPAELWVTDLAGKPEPKLLLRDLDLRLAPLWSKDGHLIVRRSRLPTQQAPADYRLLSVGIADGSERTLLHTTDAVFPIGFSANGASLLYVLLDRAGSTLYAVDLKTLTTSDVARLSDSLTRNWVLSPDSARLAYLEMTLDGANVASHAFVLDVASATKTAVPTRGDAFNPVWSTTGELAIGRAAEGGDSDGGLLRLTPTGTSRLSGPQRGFDVPLAYAPSGDRFAIRSFEGNSALSPGRSRLALLDVSGNRTTISTGEVTFLGFIER